MCFKKKKKKKNRKVWPLEGVQRRTKVEGEQTLRACREDGTCRALCCVARGDKLPTFLQFSSRNFFRFTITNNVFRN